MFRKETRMISTRWSTSWAKANRGDKGSPVTAGLWDRKKGLKAEFERVALPHLSDLYRAAFYLAKTEAEAEDLVQETYLRAFRFFDKFEPGTNCKAWLLTILKNLFITCYRRSKQDPTMVDWQKIDQAYGSLVARCEKREMCDPESLLLSKLADREIHQAVKGLPEPYRTPIILVDL